jgi:uncharacterized protein (TIGR02118 family)
MLRKFLFLKKSPNISNSSFRQLWNGPQAEHVRQSQALWKNAVRHVQNHVLPAVPGFSMEPIWDGVMQIDLSDAVVDEPLLCEDWRNMIIPRDTEFEDSAQRVQFIAKARTILDGPERGVKVFSLPRRRDGLSSADFRRHYREVHAELVRRNAAFREYANRYVQHDVLPESVRSSEGFVPYDGISEFWFDSVDVAKAAWAAPSYMAELRADEKTFVGNPPSHRVIIEETIIERV